MSTAVAEASKVKESVLELSKAITKEITLDKTTGIGMPAEGIYDKLLPEGITPAIVKSLATHNHDFSAAVVHAFADLSYKAMKENKKLAQTETSVVMNHKDVVHVTIAREKDVRVVSSGETIKVAGKISVSMDSHVGSNSGQMSTVRKEAQAHAAKLLGGK